MNIADKYRKLISVIKQKKELSGLADIIVHESLFNYLQKKNIELESLSKQDEKLIVKIVRADLRLLHGRFQPSVKKREKMLKSLDANLLLKTHSSTKERIEFYPKIKKLIESLNVKSVIDLGCGLNPLAIADRNISYKAYDINESEISLLNDYFENNSIDGKASFYDLRKFSASDFEKADLCIVFKVLDILGKYKYEITQSILEGTDCKYFLISFSTIKLSGKPMNSPKRKWFELILKNINLQPKIIKSDNEIFYLIEK